jgi:hypothetical protein
MYIPDLPLTKLRISSLSLSASEKMIKSEESLEESLFKGTLDVENALTFIGL